MAALRPPEMSSPQNLNSPKHHAMYSSLQPIALHSPRQYDRYPQPPALYTESYPRSPAYFAQSPQDKIPSPSASRSDGEVNEELTTKGRKRKRLAKACSACHKNKRRCDGFAPCANCEFSSRPCLYINAQGEIIPPPRTREPKTAATTVPAPRKEVTHTHVAPVQVPSSIKPEHTLQAVKVDHTLSSELVHLFFHHVQPYGAMFHSPTFYHRLYLSQVSPVLLHAIYAIAAHMCSSPAFLALLPPGTPPHVRGLAFAERADVLCKEVLALRTSSVTHTADFVGSWEETEIVQALVLLSTCYSGYSSTPYLELANDILYAGSASPPPAQTEGAEVEYQTHDECRRRAFWLISIHRQGVPLPTGIDLALPGADDDWERNGGNGKVLREGLVPGRAWPGQEGQIEEMGYAIRILSILNEIQGVSVANLGPADLRRKLMTLEQELKTWALSLPLNLRFHEVTLSTALTQLSSPLHFVSRAGWFFAYMHCIAESAMYHLQAALATTGERWTGERQDQAVNNIMVIMDAIGRRSRSVPLMLGPLSVITEWHLTSRSPKVDAVISSWWTEVAQNWGLDRTTIMNQRTRPNRVSTADASGLGLYNTSPITRAAGSSISTTSSIGLQTPLTGFLYPNVSVPSQHRSRSNTLKSYHTIRSRSRSPDTTWTEPKIDLRLPPLPTADLLRCGIDKTGISFFDLPKADSRLTLSPLNAFAPKTSPRFDPYENVREARGVSGAKTPDSEKKAEGMDVDRETATGIDALVSAAEKASKSPV